MHKDSAITSRRGTARESRLRARLLPSLNDALKMEVDPHASSRHVGPEAVQSRNQRAQAAAMQYEQNLALRSEPDRAIVKLPKRARPTKSSSAGRNVATIASGAATTTGTTANVHIFPNEPVYRTVTETVDVGNGYADRDD